MVVLSANQAIWLGVVGVTFIWAVVLSWSQVGPGGRLGLLLIAATLLVSTSGALVSGVLAGGVGADERESAESGSPPDRGEEPDLPPDRQAGKNQGVPSNDFESALEPLVLAVEGLGRTLADQEVSSSDIRIEVPSSFSVPVTLLVLGLFIVIWYRWLRDEVSPFAKFCKFVSIAATTLGAVAAAASACVNLYADWKNAERAGDVTVLPLQSPSAVTNVLLARPGEVALRERTAFVVPFEEAGCREGKDWPGTTPGVEHAAFLLRLGHGLARCGSDAEPVRARVMGFASSSEVKNFVRCDGAEASGEANVRIADRRARRVAELLERGARRAKPPSGLDVQVETWERQPPDWPASLKAMVEARQFRDEALGGAYDWPRGVLTRRVEVVLDSESDCALDLGP